MKNFASWREAHSSPLVTLNSQLVLEWYENLKEKANIYYHIENFEYSMREFVIKDCNGYILQFGHDIGS